MASSMHGISQVNELTPYLYLTSVYGATRENVQRKGTTLLINAAQELPKQELHGVESIKLFLDDAPYALINVHFDHIADKIHEHSARGGRVIVHCVMGVSRSTTLCIAYLMKYRGMTLKGAFDYISAKRPCVRPNPGFWQQLIEYERRINEATRQRYTPVSSAYQPSQSSAGYYYTNQTSPYGSTSIPIQMSSSTPAYRSSYGLAPASSMSNYNLSAYNDYEDAAAKARRSARSASASRDLSTSKLYKPVSTSGSSSKKFQNHSAMPTSMSSYVLPVSHHRTSLALSDAHSKYYKSITPTHTYQRASYVPRY